MPRSPLLNQCLERMDFFKELKVTMPAESFERREPKGFYPVTHVQDEEGSPAATRALADAVQEHARLDEPSLGALKSCLNEVVENVFCHAESPIEALVCAQAPGPRSDTDGRRRLTLQIESNHPQSATLPMPHPDRVGTPTPPPRPCRSCAQQAQTQTRSRHRVSMRPSQRRGYRTPQPADVRSPRSPATSTTPRGPRL
jgi:hypothetical protein